jgi:hypothetical protein
LSRLLPAHRIRKQAGVLVGERGLFLGSPAVQARLQAGVGDEDVHLDFLGVDVVLCESERSYRLGKRRESGWRDRGVCCSYYHIFFQKKGIPATLSTSLQTPKEGNLWIYVLLRELLWVWHEQRS